MIPLNMLLFRDFLSEDWSYEDVLPEGSREDI